MKRIIKNTPASVRQKLLNLSRESGKAFDYLLLLYFQERLLYRLSRSKYKKSFVLKGGMLLFAHNRLIGRTTKDIDFLGISIPNKLENIREAFLKIINMEIPDGIRFDGKSMNLERIKEDADYEGIRVTLEAYLEKAHRKIQLDIGFGDWITGGPLEFEYPSMLDMDNPHIMVYSLESLIAEKFESMLSLSAANSRMKDFYDIYILLTTISFDGPVLLQAIEITLIKRKTILNKVPEIFKESFFSLPDKLKQWQAFLKSHRISIIELKDVCLSMESFLDPVYQAILDKKSFEKRWNPDNLNWTALNKN